MRRNIWRASVYWSQCSCFVIFICKPESKIVIAAECQLHNKNGFFAHSHEVEVIYISLKFLASWPTQILSLLEVLSFAQNLSFACLFLRISPLLASLRFQKRSFSSTIHLSHCAWKTSQKKGFYPTRLWPIATKSSLFFTKTSDWGSFRCTDHKIMSTVGSE